MIDILDIKRQQIMDFEGNKKEELLVRFDTSLPFPSVFSSKAGAVYFCIRNGRGIASVPVFTGELKYFFPDFTNYDYLISEDCAVHKSVSVSVDPANKRPATVSTAYVRHPGVFLPEFRDPAPGRLFKESYRKHQAWFLWAEDFTISSPDFEEYLKAMVKRFFTFVM